MYKSTSLHYPSSPMHTLSITTKLNTLSDTNGKIHHQTLKSNTSHYTFQTYKTHLLNSCKSWIPTTPTIGPYTKTQTTSLFLSTLQTLKTPSRTHNQKLLSDSPHKINIPSTVQTSPSQHKITHSNLLHNSNQLSHHLQNSHSP